MPCFLTNRKSTLVYLYLISVSTYWRRLKNEKKSFERKNVKVSLIQMGKMF